MEGFSLDAQRRAFHEFCAQKDWEVVGTYDEEGRSAWLESSAKRPVFRQLLEDAQAGKFDVVVTHTLDRFSRNLRVMLDAFHIFTQDIDYSTPEGRLFMTMLGAFAQYFSDALSGHTKKGMRERAMQGFRTKSKKAQVIMGETVEGEGRRFTNYSVRDMLKNRFYLGEVRYKDEYFEGRHPGLISVELFEAVQARTAKSRSRRSVSGNVKSEHPHLLTKLLRCHECGTELWSQTQSSGGKTYYKSPDRGMSVICRHQGKAFVGWQFEEQVDRLFEGFQLREDWTEWIIEHHVRGQDYAAAMQKRRSISNQVERARHLYLASEIDWKHFTIVKNQAEADLVGAHIPEIEAATRAGDLLANFASVWLSSSVSSRNQLLRTVLEAVYVDLDLRLVVGLLPKPDYCSTILAMEDRSDLTVRPATTGHLTGNGGDGGESHSPSRNSPDRICYKRVRRFSLAAEDSRRQDSPAASR